MTTDDRLVSGASSLNPNKSSGDIVERTWTPEQFWEFTEGRDGIPRRHEHHGWRSTPRLRYPRCCFKEDGRGLRKWQTANILSD